MILEGKINHGLSDTC